MRVVKASRRHPPPCLVTMVLMHKSQALVCRALMESRARLLGLCTIFDISITPALMDTRAINSSARDLITFRVSGTSIQEHNQEIRLNMVHQQLRCVVRRPHHLVSHRADAKEFAAPSGNRGNVHTLDFYALIILWCYPGGALG